jgi:hypothetical protein
MEAHDTLVEPALGPFQRDLAAVITGGAVPG